MGPTGSKNVDRGVDVGVGLVAARLTSERCLGGAVHGSDVSALGAALRGVAGIDCDHVATSVFRFVRDERQQLTPARVMDGTVQPAFRGGTVGKKRPVVCGFWLGTADHVRDLQVLVHDEVVVVDEAARELVGEVFALVADPAMRAGDPVDSFAATSRASLLRLRFC